MKINKAHCFFEQSGTFKNEFIKLGIPAEDYDIQNNFGQTDHVIDLFAEIEHAYDDKQSIFDNITHDDLIIAFFPCIYFTGSTNPCYYTLENINYKNLSCKQKFDEIISRSEKREQFYKLLYKLCGVIMLKGLRMIIENPYTTLHYLHNNFLKKPTIIDTDRTLRGDYFKKPTGYWYFNCENTYGRSYQKSKIKKIVFDCKRGSKAGICSEERSMMSPDYARNFICDFIIGKSQVFTQTNLFDKIMYKPFENKSRTNRIYFDNLVRQVSCEIRLPIERRDTTWYDVELPSYCSIKNNAEKDKIDISGKTAIVFRTGKQILSKREISILSDFIFQTPQCPSLKEARERMTELFNDCQLEALNILMY